jgi:acetoin utilization deacetylase AcuC-like enzyme
MIKRENLKQAIDATSKRDPEIGYSLDTMLGAGEIAGPASAAPVDNGSGLYFIFKDQIVPIRKFLFFHEGTIPLEQQLLIKYGELAKKQELEESTAPLDYRRAAEEIQAAGLKVMVDHEIDHAIARTRTGIPNLRTMDKPATGLKADQSHRSGAEFRPGSRVQGLSDLILSLETLKRDDRPLAAFLTQAAESEARQFRFEGVVGYVTPARFIPFPFCRDALLQVAAMNLEFFHIRFILGCLLQRIDHRLFACVVEGKILGLLFLELKTHYLKKSLEIKYLATVGGLQQIPRELQTKKIRGVGTFLVAGTWLIWKSHYPQVKEIVLNAEIGALRFYRSIGFRPRRPFEYVLQQPEGFLLRSILVMVNNLFPMPSAGLLRAVIQLIADQVKGLHKSARKKEKQIHRKIIFAFLRLSLESRTHPAVADGALQMLYKYRHKLPEARELLTLATESGWVRLHRQPQPVPQPLLVAYSDQFIQHLENIFHLENAKRVQAVQSLLHHPTLAGKWLPIEPRPAAVEELAWVHTAGHIDRIAQTAGIPLSTLDLDTQTSAQSFEVARMAVGAVFSLLDAVWAGTAKRGFACIRPPGHHAEPDKAMGFCLFNNTALGARYLRNRYAVRKVMIVDIDAHHGNGTQRIFYDTDEVLYVSLHRFPGFPGSGNFGEVGCGKGEGFTVNVPLGNGHADRDFVEIIHFLVNPLARQYQPGMILVSCGFDLYLHDRLGGMRATPEGYALMTASLLDIAEQVCDGRIVFIMEGGYSIKGIQECGFALLQELCNISAVSRTKLNQIITNPVPKLEALKKTFAIHKPYWKFLQ